MELDVIRREVFQAGYKSMTQLHALQRIEKVKGNITWYNT